MINNDPPSHFLTRIDEFLKNFIGRREREVENRLRALFDPAVKNLEEKIFSPCLTGKLCGIYKLQDAVTENETTGASTPPFSTQFLTLTQ